MNNKNKTVVRSMDIVNLFIDHTELSFQEIIDLSGIPKTSVYRMLMSLEEMEFLEKGTGFEVSVRAPISQIWPSCFFKT